MVMDVMKINYGYSGDDLYVNEKKQIKMPEHLPSSHIVGWVRPVLSIIKWVKSMMKIGWKRTCMLQNP